MTYCSRCGVELEADTERCPLCGGGEFAEEEPRLTEYAPLAEASGRAPLRALVIRLVMLVTITAAAAVVLVDRFTGAGVSWAPIALIPIVATGAGAAGAIAVRGAARRFGTVWLTAMVMLVGLDAVDGAGLAWFVPVALPILALAAVVVLVARVVVRHVPAAVRGSVVLLLTALLCLGIDLAVTRFRSGTASIGWSFVVLLAAAPVALFLLVLDRTVLRVVDLRRRFHL